MAGGETDSHHRRQGAVSSSTGVISGIVFPHPAPLKRSQVRTPKKTLETLNSLNLMCTSCISRAHYSNMFSGVTVQAIHIAICH